MFPIPFCTTLPLPPLQLTAVGNSAASGRPAPAAPPVPLLAARELVSDCRVLVGALMPLSGECAPSSSSSSSSPTSGPLPR